MPSTPYKNTLRRRAVQRFVKDHQRSPSDAELRNLIAAEEAAYPTVDEVGIVGFDLKRPKYKDVSSVEIENTNRTAVYDDLTTLSTRLDELLLLLEDSHRGFYATSKRIGRLLNQTESRLDNLLLLNGTADAFVTGVEETFDTQEAVNQVLSDAQVESSYVTLGRQGYTALDLDHLKISTTVAGQANIVGKSASSPVASLKDDDGSLWEYVVYTQDQQGRVTLVLSLELPEETYVGDIRLSGLPISVNKKMTVSCFYSLDGQAFTSLAVERVATAEMAFQLGLDKVKKIQFTFSKDAADSNTSSRNRYMYVFSLDSLKIYADSYKSSQRSSLVCGPYEVKDDQGNSVYFTKATLSACTCEPEDTSVSFYLSQDGVNWSGVSHDGDAGNYVSFSDGSATQASAFIDESLATGVVLDNVSTMKDLDFQTDGVINTYIDSSYVDLVPLQSVSVKRNVVVGGAPATLLGAVPGWSFDEMTQQYSTTMYVESPDGRFLDLGDSSAYVNGSLVSGQVYIPQGYSTLATSDANWIELDTSLASVEALEAADPLYPYNHKYLAEGFPYSDSFVGDRVYQGASEIFGDLMVYRSPEEFAFAEKGDPQFFRMFTIEDVDGNWYIKVKVDKTDASWQQEIFSADWAVQSATTNKLYVKALLGTSDTGKTPRIDSFNVRVI
jgi:hypothetical protein